MSMPPPETLYVCPLDAVEAMVARVRPGHLISLVNEEAMRHLGRPASVPAHRHLRLEMNDISAPEPGLSAPLPEHVSAIIDFAVSWDRAAPLLINCLAGVSRSTAAAFTIACALNPETDEAHIARLLRDTSPTAQPNRRLVGFADEALGREGRMVRAAEAIAASAAIAPARPFAMPARIAAKE
ncbi:MAG: tyrosine phosphatase family protein [Dichotomicrobium sp.]